MPQLLRSTQHGTILLLIGIDASQSVHAEVAQVHVFALRVWDLVRRQWNGVARSDYIVVKELKIISLPLQVVFQGVDVNNGCLCCY